MEDRETILNTLENLGNDDFETLRWYLEQSNLAGCEGIPRSKLENANRGNTANNMIAAYKQRSVDVLKVILKKIGRNDLEDRLSKTSRGAEAPRQQDPAPSISQTELNPVSADTHFVDKHRNELVDRVHNIGPILDMLLQRGVIQHETYDTITDLPITQEKVRAIFKGPLKASRDNKDVFYNILEAKEPCLMKSLKDKK